MQTKVKPDPHAKIKTQLKWSKLESMENGVLLQINYPR